MTIVSVALTLILIIDPFGNLVVFQSVLQKVAPERRQKIIVRELFIALGILLLFLFLGGRFLNFFGLEQPTLSIAGGLLLLLISIGMVFPGQGVNFGLDAYDEPIVVPLATPLVAGPSAIAYLIIIAQQPQFGLYQAVVALVIAWFVSAVVLFFGQALLKLLGPRGMRALERLMGMLLILLAVQMLLDGLAEYIHTL